MTTPLEQVAEGNAALIDMLIAQQTLNESLLASISDLYTKVGGLMLNGVWTWTDQVAAPAVGAFHIQVLNGNQRHFLLSATDADNHTYTPAQLDLLLPGTSVVVMDEPGGAVTAFRQYVLSSAPSVSSGRWSFNGVRVATFGSQDTPTEGTRIRLLFG